MFVFIIRKFSLKETGHLGWGNKEILQLPRPGIKSFLVFSKLWLVVLVYTVFLRKFPTLEKRQSLFICLSKLSDLKYRPLWLCVFPVSSQFLSVLCPVIYVSMFNLTKCSFELPRQHKNYLRLTLLFLFENGILL